MKCALPFLLASPAAGVLHGSYVESADFETTSPFRGAVMSGGGSGILLFKDGDEAVILTVAHGYDLATMNAFERMDQKLNDDGGLRTAGGTVEFGLPLGSQSYATAVGGKNIIAENLGLFRWWTFDDREQCELANAANGHTGGTNDPFGCTGVGPDIDVALQRVRLTSDAAKLDFPEIRLGLDPLRVGDSITLVGFGRQTPCETWAAPTQCVANWGSNCLSVGCCSNDFQCAVESESYSQCREFGMSDALKIAKNEVRAVFYSLAYTEGSSTVGDRSKFGCADGDSVSRCGATRGSLVGDADFGSRWGTGCGGDSGGAWLRERSDGSYEAVGVNRAAAIVKEGPDNAWNMEKDTTYTEGDLECRDEDGITPMDACESKGSDLSTLYPVRARIKAALKAWKPGWEAKAATYACEPPTLENPTCGAGCKMCGARGEFDCFPQDYACETLDQVGSAYASTCGENLSPDSTPKQNCVGGDKSHETPCRALTDGAGPKQTQLCAAGTAEGCPALYTCCADNGGCVAADKKGKKSKKGKKGKKKKQGKKKGKKAKNGKKAKKGGKKKL